MEFMSDEHRQFYESHNDITDKGKDYAALIYVLGLSETCRDHFTQIYNADGRAVRPECLTAGWQTTTSGALTRLAMNLFTWGVPGGCFPAEFTASAIFQDLNGDAKIGAAQALLYFT